MAQRTWWCSVMLGLAMSLSAQSSAPASSASFERWVAGLEEKNIRVSAGLWDLKTGNFLEGINEDRALIPASTTKVVSTYALMKLWKPDYTIETEVYGDFDGRQTITSDLVFKGAGDPFLVIERLWVMVHDLKEKGIRTIRGSLVFDQSAFDGERYNKTWQGTSRDTTPAIAAFSVNFNRDEGRLVQDPNRLARTMIESLLLANGIALREETDAPSPRTKIYTLESPPLRELVSSINKFSNNFMIEMLVKRLGEGSWPSGIRKIQNFYDQSLGLSPRQINLFDGSGLSKDNRLSAKTLSIILRAAWSDFEVGSEFLSSLKIIGGEPFRLRQNDPTLARRLRVKSGYLNGTRSLVGYLQMKNGDLRVFAILLNGASTEDDLWNQIDRWVD